MSGKPSRSAATVKTAGPGGPRGKARGKSGGRAPGNGPPNGRKPKFGHPRSGDDPTRVGEAIEKPAAGDPVAKDRGVKAARTSRVVIRRIDPVTVLKVSILFYLSMCIALFTAGLLLWAGAHAVGIVNNVESFMDEVGFTDFRLDGSRLLQGFALLGLGLVVVGSVANLLMAVLYNLIGDVVGGVKMVLSEDTRPPRS